MASSKPSGSAAAAAAAAESDEEIDFSSEEVWGENPPSEPGFSTTARTISSPNLLILFFFYGQEEEEELERELADVPFEELQKARADGSHVSRPPRSAPKSKPGRANKNRPMEMSSKVRVGRFREVIQAPKRVVRDPRFESLCGTLDTDGFRKRYNFLFEVELPAEKEKLHKLIKKSKDPTIVEELKNHISWIDKQLKSGPQKTAESEILSDHIKKEREAAKRGKRPYYLKKSEIRKRKLIKKYDELKAEGKLDSYIEKRRKKNASKDHRYMPYRRSNDGARQ